MSERDTFVVCHVTKHQARKLRSLIHAQKWYDGEDVSIEQGSYINRAGIITGRIADDLSRFFNYLHDLRS